MITEFPKIDFQIPPTIKVYYLESGLAIFAVPSNPEGIVAANPGSFAIDNVGNWYRKVTGTGKTGWQIANVGAPSPGVPIALPPLTTEVVANPPSTIMQQYIVPGNTLKQTGDYFEFDAWGRIANNSNLKGVVLGVNQPSGPVGSNIISEANLPLIGEPASGTLGLNSAMNWRIFGKVIRVSINTSMAMATYVVGRAILGAGATTAPQNGYIIVSRSNILAPTDFTGAYILQFTGFVTATADVTGQIVTCVVYNF
jgi:hypothetical protein